MSSWGSSDNQYGNKNFHSDPYFFGTNQHGSFTSNLLMPAAQNMPSDRMGMINQMKYQQNYSQPMDLQCYGANAQLDNSNRFVRNLDGRIKKEPMDCGLDMNYSAVNAYR